MYSQLQAVTSETFVKTFGTEPKHFFWAPGRVNLIGEHTDYNDGFVLPCAINYGTVIAATPRDDNRIVVIACDYNNARSEFDLSESIERAEENNFWCNYIRGTVQALIKKGHHLRGANLTVSGNVPQGAGLSSSASLEVVTGLALSRLNGLDISLPQLALAGQSAENDFVGSNTGIMDQMISACGKPDHAMLLDCRSLETRSISIPAGAAVVIIHSKVKRGLVDSEYNTRRKQCESAARVMRVQALRDATMTMLEDHKGSMDNTTFLRARHVITENIRTLAAEDALGKGDLARMGELMAASHISMRDDFEITVPAIDALVEIVDSAITAEGGVRMTGGGFGGCIVALVPEANVSAIRIAVEREYPKRSGLNAEIHICKASAGASILSNESVTV